MTDPASYLPPVLDAWEALVLAADPTRGRRCLRCREAFVAGTPEQREALAVALVGAGCPQATMSPHHLGQALASLRGMIVGGRSFGMSLAKGSALWYVSGNTMAARVLGPTEPMVLPPAAKFA